MNRGAKGSRLEHDVRRILEADGYHVVRSSGSHTAIDLVAWNTDDLRLVQVKSGGVDEGNIRKIKSAVRMEMRDVPVIEGGSRELWIKRKGEWLRWNLVDGMEGPEWQPMK